MKKLTVVKQDEEAPQFGIEDALRLKETFDSLENEVDKWKFLFQIKDYVVVVLDNDCTSIEYRNPADFDERIPDPDGDDFLFSEFKEHTGRDYGVFNILIALGITVIGS